MRWANRSWSECRWCRVLPIQTRTWPALFRHCADCPDLLRVDLLPYNKAAGSKYRYAGMEFKPDYDESRELNLNTALFEQAGIKVIVV